MKLNKNKIISFGICTATMVTLYSTIKTIKKCYTHYETDNEDYENIKEKANFINNIQTHNENNSCEEKIEDNIQIHNENNSYEEKIEDNIQIYNENNSYEEKIEDYEYINYRDIIDNQEDITENKNIYKNIKIIDRNDIKKYKKEFYLIQENSIITPTKAIAYFTQENNISLNNLVKLYNLTNIELNSPLSIEEFCIINHFLKSNPN